MMSRSNSILSALGSAAAEVLVDEVESMDVSRDPTMESAPAESAFTWALIIKSKG